MDDSFETRLGDRQIEWVESEDALLAAVAELKAMIRRHEAERSPSPLPASRAA